VAALCVEQSTVEIGIAPERVILDVRGRHFDTEGRRFTNGVVNLGIRDLDILIADLRAAREPALSLPSPQPGLWSALSYRRTA
jgi:hypothetical protein